MMVPLRLLSASHAARCVVCQGVRSHTVPVALVGECSIPVVQNIAHQPFSSQRLVTNVSRQDEV